MGQRILLTGSQGFIGRNLVQRLTGAYDDLEFITLDKVPGAQLVHDLTQPLTWIPGRPVDAIFHLAAQSGVRTDVPNVEAYNQILAHNIGWWARQHRVKTIVHASSSSIYGNTPFMGEYVGPAPASPYGRSKVRAEAMLDQWAELTLSRVIHLRLFNNIGRYQRPNMLPYLVADHLLNNAPLTLLGQRQRGWTYVGDTARAFATVLMQCGCGPVNRSYTFNVGTGWSITQQELIEMFEYETVSHAHPVQAPGHPNDVASTRADTTRFLATFGWEPRHENIREGIKEVLQTVQTTAGVPAVI